MSLAISEHQKSKFLTRFDLLWEALRRYQLREGMAWSFLAGALGLIALVGADYRLELPTNAREIGRASCRERVLVAV